MRLSFWRRASQYSSVPESDDPEDARSPSPAIKKREPLWWIFVSITTFLCFFSVVTFALSFFPSSFVPLRQCGSPTVRREWRTLERNERLAYVQAARCLTESPSSRRSNTSIHDDFVLLHSRIGNYCMYSLGVLSGGKPRLMKYIAHNAAPFLPWHRYFIHLYEQALHKHCNYTGVLPCVLSFYPSLG